MRNVIIYLMLSVGVVTTLYAADAAAQAELQKLQSERIQLTKAMVSKRLELIKGDSDLQALHDQIMSLHKELALRLNGKPEMRQLLQQAEELDAKIGKLSEIR